MTVTCYGVCERSPMAKQKPLQLLEFTNVVCVCVCVCCLDFVPMQIPKKKKQKKN